MIIVFVERLNGLPPFIVFFSIHHFLLQAAPSLVEIKHLYISSANRTFNLEIVLRSPIFYNALSYEKKELL